MSGLFTDHDGSSMNSVKIGAESMTETAEEFLDGVRNYISFNSLIKFTTRKTTVV